MRVKTTQMIQYLLHSAFAAAIYGLIAYFGIFRGLAGQNELHSYIWNVVFIIIFILLDKIINKVLLAKDYVITKKNYFTAALMHTASFISFKTTLYLFYIFVLITSWLSQLRPDLLHEQFQSFIFSIEGCLILLVAFDAFMLHLLKDDERIKRITAKFERFGNFKAKRKNREE